MSDFIKDSFNSWKSYDSAGNPQLFVNNQGNLDVSGDRLATPSEVRNSSSSVLDYLYGDQNIGLAGGVYKQNGEPADD